MHIPRREIEILTDHAHHFNRLVSFFLVEPMRLISARILSGVDARHCGEVRDATLHTPRSFKRLNASMQPPPQQEISCTGKQIPLRPLHAPACHPIETKHHLLGSVPLFSGCPFTCQFGEILKRYGRHSR